jgi:hypothetical protein
LRADERDESVRIDQTDLPGRRNRDGLRHSNTAGNFRMARMREFVHTGKSTTTRTHQSSLIDPV